MTNAILVAVVMSFLLLLLKLGSMGRDHLAPPSDTGLDHTDKVNSAYGLAAAAAHYWLQRARVSARQRIILGAIGAVIGFILSYAFEVWTQSSP